MATSKPGRAAGTPDATADLAKRLADPGFTPSVRRLGELLDLFGHDDEDVAKDAARAVLRIEAQYAARVAAESVARARTSARPARGRLADLVGRLAQEGRDPNGESRAWLIEVLADPDPKTRRAAARALGKVERTDAIEAALAEAFDRAASEDDRRVLAMALGKLGGRAAATRLAGGDHGRASVIVDRELARQAPGAIVPERALGRPRAVWFHTRSGLEDVVKDELGTAFAKPRFVAPGVVEAELAGPLASALAIRTATHVGFPLAPLAKGKDLAADIVRAVCSADALAIFRAFTEAPEDAAIRFRLELTRGGHRRAVAWRVAELVRAETRVLVNDPKASTWEVHVDDAGPEVKVELVPRGYEDARFVWRRDLVAASSHPAIAAALARVAPRSDDDVVWDPFAGAGAELIERARLGPYARLVGTDVDPRAIGAARANFERAGIAPAGASLVEADATAYSPEGVTLIVTNPPMGRRVQRGAHGDLLERFVAHAARVLVPGGALVWLVPEPRRIRERAAAAGLELVRAFSVDMGGFSAELAVYMRRAAGKRRIVRGPEADAERPKLREKRKRGSR
ncbi:MAG: methyltransferase [Labilithrix sp.]|nr:methyltransferase [Labilithrix sp.]